MRHIYLRLQYIFTNLPKCDVILTWTSFGRLVSDSVSFVGLSISTYLNVLLLNLNNNNNINNNLFAKNLYHVSKQSPTDRSVTSTAWPSTSSLWAIRQRGEDLDRLAAAGQRFRHRCGQWRFRVVAQPNKLLPSDRMLREQPYTYYGAYPLRRVGYRCWAAGRADSIRQLVPVAPLGTSTSAPHLSHSLSLKQRCYTLHDERHLAPSTR